MASGEAVSGYLIKKAGLMLAGHLGALVSARVPSLAPGLPQRTAAPSFPLVLCRTSTTFLKIRFSRSCPWQIPP